MGLDLGCLGGLFKVLDLPGMLVGEGCKALGLPPAVGDALKIGLGAATGDFMMVANGAMGLGGDLQRCPPPACTSYYPSSYPQVACCGYAPLSGPVSPAVAGGPALAFEEQQALGTLLSNFDYAESRGALFNSHDGLLSLHDLHCISDDASAPADLKRAARFFLDRPGFFQQIARSSPTLFNERFATRADLQIALQDTARMGGGCGGIPTPPWGGLPGAGYPGAGLPGFGLPPYGGGFPLPYPGTGQCLPPSPVGGCLPWGGNQGLSPFGCGLGVSGILNNPMMSEEDKVEAVLQQLESQTDQNLLATTTALNQRNSALAAIPAGSTDQSAVQQRAQLQNDQQTLNLELTKLVDRRKNLFDLMSNIHEKFNEMSKLAIQNMGR